MALIVSDPQLAQPRGSRVGSGLHARFALDAGLDVPLGHHTRPTWRGRVHLIGLCLAAPAVAMLYASADGPRTRFAVTVYAAGLCSMLLVSITYHRWVHLLCARARWRRADHAMIFAAIAGSTTPIALIAAPGPRGLVAIAMVWLMSIIGAGCKVARWERGDVVGSVFYAAVSVTSATLLPSLWHHSGMAPAVLFMASGSVYAGGAICFARGWPRVRPTVFSFHEVWHVMTLIAAGAHFAAVWSIAT